MATFGKKPAPKKKRLGAPPPLEDVSTTLVSPEHAPTSPAERKARAKTGRTVPFGTKVTSEFDERFREVAFHAKLKHSELLEEMLTLYESEKDKK